MNPIIIEKTERTPAINFNASTGILKVKGRSIPEHTFEFYNPILVWMEEYLQKPQKKTVLDILLEYYNTASSKAIFDILKKLADYHNKTTEVVIEWKYEDDDEDMYESGLDFQSMVRALPPFQLIPVPVED